MQKLHKKKPELPPYVTVRGDEWHVRVGVPTKQKDKKGRIKYLQFTRKCEPKTEERAAEIVKYLKNEKNKKKETSQGPLLVNKSLSEFLAAKKGSIARRTHDYYTFLFEKHIKESSISTIELSTLKAKQIQAFYRELADQGASANLIRRVHVFLKMAFKQAIAWEDLAKNPCDGILVPRPKSKESPYLRAHEAKRFVEACKKTDDNIVFELDLETGLRPQEILALSWSDIDFEACRVSVKKALTEKLNGGEVVIDVPKTAASVRSVSFSKAMKERLLVHRERQRRKLIELRGELDKPALLEHMKKKGVNYDRRRTRKREIRKTLENFVLYDLVFPGENGQPQSIKNVNRRRFRSIVEEAGLDPKKYSFKTLRHTCATILAKKIGPKRLQKFLGQAEISTTMNYYVHVDEDSQFELSEEMANVLYSI